MTREPFVHTKDIRAAVQGREADVLAALKINWRAGRPHITCILLPVWKGLELSEKGVAV